MRRQRLFDLGDDSLVDSWVRDDSLALGDLLAAGLELRLDEQDHRRTPDAHSDKRADHALQRDEREIGDDGIDGPTDVYGLDLADVVAFEHEHPLIIADEWVQLTVTDVERDDGRRAGLEEAVGESTSGRTRVENASTADVDRERSQSSVQFLATSRNEASRRTFDDNRVGGVDLA